MTCINASKKGKGRVLTQEARLFVCGLRKLI